MRSEIILIGPIRSGKSTVARLLARRLGVACISLDQERWRYFEEAGYDRTHASQLSIEQGFTALYAYRKPFEAVAVKRVLEDFPGAVFDFGATHSVYEDEMLLARVVQDLSPFANVVLLQPSADPAESARVLTSRTGGMVREGFDFVAHFVKHPSNRLLAKTVILTAGLSPEETCEEILKKIAKADAPKHEDLDRSTYAQHIVLQRERLPGPSDGSDVLGRVQREQREGLRCRLEPSLDLPLPEESRRFVNSCFGEVDTLVEAALEDATGMSREARTHGRALYARRLTRGETLRDLLQCDPLDGVLPFEDGPSLELLLRGDATTPAVRDLQRDALRLRFLRRPQRTRYLFLHELATAHFMNAFQEPLAAELTAEELGATTVTALARLVGKSRAEILGLHCADNATVERVLPQCARDLLLVSAHVQLYVELAMHFRCGQRKSRVLSDVLRHFTLPSLAKMATRPRMELAPQAGARIDRAFMARLYGTHAPLPTAHDVREMLLFCADGVWQDRPQQAPAAHDAAPNSAH